MPDEPNDPAESTFRLIKQVAELEKERDRYKREGEITKLKLGVAENKLAEIEQQMVSVLPPRAGAEGIAPRVGQLVAQLREQRELADTLQRNRRELHERRARWEQIVDAATSQTAVRLDDPGASARAVAVYADELLAQAAERYGSLPPKEG